jgi:hypothetical protein
MSGLIVGSARYRSVQNILPSALLSKNLKVKLHRTLEVDLTLREDVIG